MKYSFVAHLIKKYVKGARRKSAKRWEHKIKLVEPSFKDLVLGLYYYCRDHVKYGLLSKNLFWRKQQYEGWENFSVTKNFYKNQ